MICLCTSSPTAISAQGMQTIWRGKNICCDEREEASSDAATEAAKTDTVLMCIFSLFFQFLLFKAMRQGMDCARTIEPSLCARSLIPHIPSYDRTHPSVLSFHAESESPHSHCSALSVKARRHTRVGAEEKNSACSWQWGWSRLIGTGAGGGDGARAYRQNWSRVLLELLLELKVMDGAVGQRNLTLQVCRAGPGKAEMNELCLSVTSTCAPSSAAAGGTQDVCKNWALTGRSVKADMISSLY